MRQALYIQDIKRKFRIEELKKYASVLKVLLSNILSLLITDDCQK